jgi:hypothetical protein
MVAGDCSVDSFIPASTPQKLATAWEQIWEQTL